MSNSAPSNGQIFSFVLLSAVVVTGCHFETPLVDSSGIVLYQGKPAVGATILFHPERESSSAVPSQGLADAEGRFRLSTRGRPGIPPGRYRVTVVWPSSTEGVDQSENLWSSSSEGPDLLKGKYASRKNSKLLIEIQPEQREIPAIELD